VHASGEGRQNGVVDEFIGEVGEGEEELRLAVVGGGQGNLDDLLDAVNNSLSRESHKLMM